MGDIDRRYTSGPPSIPNPASWLSKQWREIEAAKQRAVVRNQVDMYDAWVADQKSVVDHERKVRDMRRRGLRTEHVMDRQTELIRNVVRRAEEYPAVAKELFETYSVWKANEHYHIGTDN